MVDRELDLAGLTLKSLRFGVGRFLEDEVKDDVFWGVIWENEFVNRPSRIEVLGSDELEITYSISEYFPMIGLIDGKASAGNKSLQCIVCVVPRSEKILQVMRPVPSQSEKPYAVSSIVEFDGGDENKERINITFGDEYAGISITRKVDNEGLVVFNFARR